MLAAIGFTAGLGSHLAAEYREHQKVKAVAADVARFKQTLSYQAALKQAELNSRGWPVTIDAEWFGSDPPRNRLVSPDRPWVEIATPGQAEMMDPPVRITIDNSVASFWYNPYQGVVRARVPLVLSDQRALELYNTINGTRLDTIYGKEMPVEPAPATPEIKAAEAPAELFGPPRPEESVAGADDGSLDPTRPQDDPPRE